MSCYGDLSEQKSADIHEKNFPMKKLIFSRNFFLVFITLNMKKRNNFFIYY